ncbi:MAG TPA: NAD-dependent epimerase [Opitutaceae bacterium]|jgi:UDP-glucuronate 4-epimerase|nr:NAD-dependent epimerase [Opitutaceae bacterium]
MILVTGSAGFIGFHVALRLLRDGETVHGLDNLSPYYDVALKRARLAVLAKQGKFIQHQADLADPEAMAPLFERHRFQAVIHLAAQPGVRYSLENPRAYLDSNLTGFLHLLEGCRRQSISHLVFASSSSVYGLNTAMPFSVHQNADHPASLYAATKKANELMAHSYSHVFGLPVTGLRLFTVYGPWGRPDMALFHFTRSILEGKPIELYDEGRMKRDFTYIDDVVEGIVRVLRRPPAPNPSWRGDAPDPATSSAPYRLYNIGNHAPVELGRFVETLETCLGRKAIKRLVAAQATEVPASYADVTDLSRDVGFAPSTPLETGIRHFVDWYRSYYSA